MEHIEEECSGASLSGHLLSLDVMSLWKLHNGVCVGSGVW